MEGFEENEDQTEDEPKPIQSSNIDPEAISTKQNTSVEDSKERETTKEQGERKWRKVIGRGPLVGRP